MSQSKEQRALEVAMEALREISCPHSAIERREIALEAGIQVNHILSEGADEQPSAGGDSRVEAQCGTPAPEVTVPAAGRSSSISPSAGGDKSAETRAEAGTLRCGQTAPPPAPSSPPDAEAVWCSACEGQGYFRHVSLGDGAVETNRRQCFMCHGTGRVRLPTETGRESS